MPRLILLIISLLYSFNVFAGAANSSASPASEATLPLADDTAKSDSGKDEAVKKDIEYSNAWARPSYSANNNSAAYFTIKNNSDKELTIVGASALDVANNVEVHKSFVDEKGISKMTPVDKLVVPANAMVEFGPGVHIMLLDLKTTLNLGDKFKINLNFLERDPLTIEVEVKITSYDY